MRAEEASIDTFDSRYFRSGEFAALCRTTKETLRHYRNIGLLEPASIAENGYALYSPLQLGDFLLIDSLKRGGSPLETIRDYLENPHDEGLEAIIEDHIDRLRRERSMLLARQRLLEGTLERRRSLSSWREHPDGWRIAECAEERFTEIDISGLLKEDELESGQNEELMGQLIDQGFGGIRTGAIHEMQGSYRIGRKALLAGKPEDDFHLCLRSTGSKRGQAKHVKPEGTYFQMLRSASIDSLLAEIGGYFADHHALLAEAERQGYQPIGDIYEQELSLYTGDIAAEAFTELSVRIDTP